jgi:hypothetical protein
MMKSGSLIILLLLICIGVLNAQMPLPTGVSYFPETLGRIADSRFYSDCQPLFSSVNMKADVGGNHKNLFILTMSLFESKPVSVPEGCIVKTYPTQALLLSADSIGLFPRWITNFNDDSAATDANILGLFRYYPEYGVYTYVRNDGYRAAGDNLMILDSTFHQVDLIPFCISNGHDFQLSKTPDGKWQIISCRKSSHPHTGKFEDDYSIISYIYDHDTIQSKTWICQPTKATIDTAEWSSIYTHCDAVHKGGKRPDDTFHPNSWQAFEWSKDSILVAVSERNDDKVRFWWVTDSAGKWVTRDMFRLASYNNCFNDFSFPFDPQFQISGGHNFRILRRLGNTILASYYDDEQCSGKIPARGLVLSMDLEKKICHVLQYRSQGSYATGRGNIHVMLDGKNEITAQSLLKSNTCLAWGGWAPSPNSPAKGYFPSNDTSKRCWEISVLNPQNQTIVGITVADLGYYTHHIVLNNSEYQAQAWYDLPIPSHPIQCAISGNQVTLTTDFVHPTWITGDTTSTITVTMPGKDKSVRIWVRGKTDKTMVGELWENILVSADMKKKYKK